MALMVEDNEFKNHGRSVFAVEFRMLQLRAGTGARITGDGFLEA